MGLGQNWDGLVWVSPFTPVCLVRCNRESACEFGGGDKGFDPFVVCGDAQPCSWHKMRAR